MDIYKKNEYHFEMDSTTPLRSLINLQQLIFEVTSFCNLQCVYCGYGSLYNTRRESSGENMTFSTAKTIIDYLFDLWCRNSVDYNRKKTFIGFYGGEPLVNIKLIIKIIEYIESLPQPPKRYFHYTMTTNAMLLNKYMDYLVQKNFRLLISLDGDEKAHSYRIDLKGENSFTKVMSNVKLLQSTYPDYFERNVSFNAVLTSRGEVFRIKEFVFNNFGKNLQISEMNDFGILPEKEQQYKQISRSFSNDWKNKVDIEKHEHYFSDSPEVKQLYRILKYLSGNSFASYDSLLSNRKNKLFPTGTCLPLSKKLFVTTLGDILPCERINQNFKLGSVSDREVDLDLTIIAEKYSNYYKKVWRQCKSCYMKPICEQCLFYINDLDTDKPICPNYKNKKNYDDYIAYFMNFISENSSLYNKIMNELY